jgi:hypothetical protein
VIELPKLPKLQVANAVLDRILSLRATKPAKVPR